jgi:hypothetical protein
VVAKLDEFRWAKVLDSGWCPWDVAVYIDPWMVVTICTTQEDHEGGRRLFRARIKQCYRPHTLLFAGIGAMAAGAVVIADPVVGIGIALGFAAALGYAWLGGARVLRAVRGVVHDAAAKLNLVRVEQTAIRSLSTSSSGAMVRRNGSRAVAS